MANNGEKKADEWVEDPDSDIMDAKVVIMMMLMVVTVIKMKISRDWVMKSLVKVDIFHPSCFPFIQLSIDDQVIG